MKIRGRTLSRSKSAQFSKCPTGVIQRTQNRTRLVKTHEGLTFYEYQYDSHDFTAHGILAWHGTRHGTQTNDSHSAHLFNFT